MKIKIYPSAVISGVMLGVVISMFLFQPKPKAAEIKNVKLEHVMHLVCGFEAETYKPFEIIDGLRYPAECGCSELKGTCHITKKIQYVLP